MIKANDAWPGYVAIATVGYVLYSIGTIGPYLRERLDLSDVQVGLHSTALAVGFVVAGAFAARFGARFGELAARGGALSLIGIAVVVVAWAPSVVTTLAAAVAIGIGAGTVLGYTNASLVAPGGSLGRLRIGRANVWAMVAAFSAPVLLAVGASVGVGSVIWLVPPLLLVAIDALDLRGDPRLALDDETKAERLPNAFWIAWAYLVAVVAVEACIVFWAATLVERRTGTSVEESSLVAAAFFAGMFTGRLGLSAGIGTGGDVRLPIGAGLVLAASGAAMAWLSAAPLLSALALFAAGGGVAVLYPLGVSAALATTPGQLSLAGARLTLASGVALLVAPLALGVLADVTGVIVGWTLVIIIAIAALGLSRLLPSRSVSADAPVTPVGAPPG